MYEHIVYEFLTYDIELANNMAPSVGLMPKYQILVSPKASETQCTVGRFTTQVGMITAKMSKNNFFSHVFSPYDFVNFSWHEKTWDTTDI